MSVGIKKITKTICMILVISVLLLLFGCDTQGYKFSGFGMDCVYSFKLYSNEDSSLKVSNRIKKEIENYEKLLSAFDTSSITYKLNARADISGEDLGEIINIINTCNKVSSLCSDRYSVVCGALTRLWNVTGDNPVIPSNIDILKAVALCKSGLVSTENGNIRFLKDGVTLDFGSVGKGYACDKVIQILKDEQISDAIVSFGGPVLTYGTKGGEGWKIDIRSPFDNSKAGTFNVDNTSFISTSGGYERFLEKDGNTYHHIFDLKDGMPSSSDLASVTVISDSGVLSDALSTACFIVGMNESVKILDSFDNTSAIFITKDKQIYAYNFSGSFETQSSFIFKGEI